MLDNGNCVQSCQTYGTVPNILICSPCDSHCLTCLSSITNCLTCNTSSTYPYLYNNTCLNSCPNGYYNDNTTFLCFPCKSPCETCLSSSQYQCISCISPYALYGTVCSSSCPLTYFSNGSQCSACIQPCLTCLSLSLCLSCQTNYSLFSSNYSCLGACPVGYISINQSCIPCSSNCFSCVAVSFCLTCHSGSYLLNGVCLNPCSTSYYANTTLQ